MVNLSQPGAAMSDTINYGAMMHRAMRGLIRDLLAEVEAAGELPGEHHFFITFDTRHPGVGIADWLRDRYPEEMTVIMQNWYADLSVRDKAFSVTLNFGNQPEPLHIPFKAIKTFADPSVEFGLRFETEDDEEEDEVPESPMIVIDDDGEDGDEYDEDDTPSGRGDAEVVSLDSFRKN